MDEEEYEDYLRHVFGLHEYEQENVPLREQLRGEDGRRVSGCYRMVPAE